MYLANQLSDAIISALQTGGINARSFESDPTSKEFLKIADISPVALLQFNSSDKTKLRTAILKGKLFHFNLYFKAKNLRSPSSALTGDGQGSGIYQVMENAKQLLDGNRLGLNIQPLEIVSEKPFIKNSRQSVYLQELKIAIYE